GGRHFLRSPTERLRLKPLPQYRDGAFLPRQFTRQGVDLRLALGGNGSEVSAIPFEECAGIRGLSTSISALLLAKLRYQRRHAPSDVPIYHVKLALRLPASFLHAEELCGAILS
ncbi:hypothetical protein, partial [Phyllobacterium sp. YR531]|uniref:hypothetical protein n=1 Tax=Phyllobacterium sp. YR531 TaxID=1144343 RepID=UPI001AEBDADC